MDVFEVAKWMGGTAGLIVSYPLARFIFRFASDWGAHTEAIRFTSSNITELKQQLSAANQRNFEASKEASAKIDAMAASNADEHAELFKRTDRNEVALIGLDGRNGIRNDVKQAAKAAELAHFKAAEVADVLVQHNTNFQTELAKTFLWRQGTTATLSNHGQRLDVVEEELKGGTRQSQRRKITRKPAGRRKGEQ